MLKRLRGLFICEASFWSFLSEKWKTLPLEAFLETLMFLRTACNRFYDVVTNNVGSNFVNVVMQLCHVVSFYFEVAEKKSISNYQ